MNQTCTIHSLYVAGFWSICHFRQPLSRLQTVSTENHHESVKWVRPERCVACERDMLTLLVGAETLLCFLACLTYFQRPDKLQHHETLLYVWPQLHPREGRVDSEESPFSEQVICPQCHTLSKGQTQTCDSVMCKVCKNLLKVHQ